MSVLHLPEEEWLVKKNQYKERIATITIPLDMTPGIGKGLLSRIDSFFSEVQIELGELEEEKEKIDSIIREWERVKATGSNDTVRKKNASEALQEYPISPEVKINLYEVQRKIYSRHSFLKSIVSTLKGKHDRIITVGGLLKLEHDLVPHSNIGPDN